MTTAAPTRLASAALAPVLLVLAGCCSAECDPDRLPLRGHASSPDGLAKIVQHEARFECWSGLYDLLSKRTRSKYGRTEWRLGVSHMTIPEYDYKVVDVVEKGTYVASLPDPATPDEAIAIYDYAEPGKKPLSAHVLLRREAIPATEGPSGPDPDREWRIALVDQEERIEAGDGRYWWFEGARPAVKKPAGGK